MTVLFTDDHEWLKVDGDIVTVGITNHAQEQLGDVVFVEVPDIGTTVSKQEEVAVVESVKAASEVYAPLSGEIVEANQTIVDNPGLVNEDAEGAAWFFKIRMSDRSELDGLMDQSAYATHLASLA